MEDPKGQSPAAAVDLEASAYHFPPEFLSLLVDTIPLLCRSKLDVVVFFRGAGVPGSFLDEWEARVRRDRDSVRKHEMARDVLRRLNEAGDSCIRERRDVVRRVVEFEDYSTCWESDRLKAEGLVARVRAVLDVKDSFARMRIERERELAKNRAKHAADAKAEQARRAERQQIKDDLFRLFAETDHQKRGKALEGVLNRLFQSYGILVKTAFTRRGSEGEGVIEQIDGAIELDGHLYLVEMKWWDKPIGVPEISPLLVRVYTRGEARGICISASGFTAPAIAQVEEALHQKVVVLFEIQEIVFALEQDSDLRELLRKKVQEAIAQMEQLSRT